MNYAFIHRQLAISHKRRLQWLENYALCIMNYALKNCHSSAQRQTTAEPQAAVRTLSY